MPAPHPGSASYANRNGQLIANSPAFSGRVQITRDFTCKPLSESSDNGITPSRAWVEIGDRALEARFGPWQVRTGIANILGAEVTGPYAFLKTVGPARLAVTDRGLTFASNGDRGVLITFRTPIPGLEPLGLLRHPELTVTVTDVEGLAALVRAQTG